MPPRKLRLTSVSVNSQSQSNLTLVDADRFGEEGPSIPHDVHEEQMAVRAGAIDVGTYRSSPERRPLIGTADKLARLRNQWTTSPAG
jgi:hypothetical protein